MNPRRLLHGFFCLVLLVLAFGVHPTQAALSAPDPNPTDDQPVSDLASLLGPDGSLDIPPGLTGSFDTEGWRMALDEQGQPHFFPLQSEPTAALPDDPFWSSNFMLGVETIGNENFSNIFAIAVMAGQKVFVGGDFTAAGGVPANNIACWDSQTGSWEALGPGLNSRVKTIKVHDSYVYVGGNFNRAGDIFTGPLARWNTNTHTWIGLGTFTSDQGTPVVEAIAVSGNDEIYAGGYFLRVNGILVNNIAMLDAAGWHALNNGILGNAPNTATVYSLYISVYDILYVGGSFTTAGGIPASNLAQWDGNNWYPLGGGVGGINAVVSAIAFRTSTIIFVGGYFDEAYDGHGGTVDVSNIAMWNGASWSNLGGGVNSDVYALLDLGTGLHVAGRFSMAGGVPARNLAVWLNSYWTTVKDPDEDNDGTDGNIYAIYSFSDYIVIGGSFEHAGDHVAHHIAAISWDKTKWVAMGGSVNGPIHSLTISSGYVYVGGTFTTASNLFQAYLARWRIATNTWAIVGNGAAITGCSGFNCTPVVKTIYVRGEDIYIGGNFIQIGPLTVNGIARFNGGFDDYGWHTLGSGVGCSMLPCIITVRDIAISGTNVYIGGSFDTAGGVPVNNVAVWNGSSWSALQDLSSNGTNGTVYALALVPLGIVVGGSFNSPYPYIARWNGSNWTTVGDGINGAVYTMIGGGLSGPLYIGGAFTTINHVAMLSGSAWHSLGAGLDGNVRALAFDDSGGIYAGGDFVTSAAATLNYVGHWNGYGWFPVGSGTNGPVYSMAAMGKRLMVGGVFTTAGEYPSFFLGSWNKVPTFLPIIRKLPLTPPLP